MKTISKYILESQEDWECLGNAYGGNFAYNDKKEYLWFSTEGNKYGFLDLKEIYRMANDNEDHIFADEIAKLKKGECYDADGGINIYIKIK